MPDLPRSGDLSLPANTSPALGEIVAMPAYLEKEVSFNSKNNTLHVPYRWRKKRLSVLRAMETALHDLQHRFGYRMAALVPLHRLAQIMGHDSLDTTMIYVQGTKQDLQQEVEKIAWA